MHVAGNARVVCVRKMRGKGEGKKGDRTRQWNVGQEKVGHRGRRAGGVVQSRGAVDGRDQAVVEAAVNLSM